MEAFLSEMLVCFPVLGIFAFERPADRATRKHVLTAKGRGTDARGYETDDGFVVEAGSIVSSTEVDSAPAYLSSSRRQLFDAGVIAIQGGRWVMTQDYVFGSPSTAAGVVLGRSANGRTEWKDANGRTLKQLQEANG